MKILYEKKDRKEKNGNVIYESILSKAVAERKKINQVKNTLKELRKKEELIY